MNKNLKAILSVSSTVLVLAIIFITVQYFTKPASQQTATPAGGTAGNVTQALSKISDEEIFDFWVSTGTHDIYYLKPTGQIMKLIPGQNSQVVSFQAVPGLSYVKPAKDGLSAIVAFGYPKSPSFSVFNIGRRTFQALPQGATTADWDPSSNNRIAYLKEVNGSGSLNIIDLATGKSSEILKINQKDSDLSWPTANMIYIAERPSTQIGNSVWSYNLKTKIWKTVSNSQNDTLIKWLPGTNLGLKWAGGSLSLVDIDGQTIASTRLKAWPNKCALGGSFIYCSSNDKEPANFADSLIGNPSADEQIYQMLFAGVKSGQNLAAIRLTDKNILTSKIVSLHLEKLENNLLILNQLDHKLYSLSL